MVPLLRPLGVADDEVGHVASREATRHAIVEDAVAVVRLGRHEEGASHPLAVHDRHLVARLLDDAAVVLDAQLGRVGIDHEGLDGPDNIGHETVHVLELGGLEAHDRIEADADAVGEVPALGIVAAGHLAYVYWAP